MNYFEIFGLEEKFSLELNTLTERYQTIQKSVHPDRFAHASNQEKLLAAKKSTLINDAYQTLKNPLSRAEYMLELRDVSLPNEQASFSDNAFLMRQMELREMLAEVKFADNVESAVFEASQVLEVEFEQHFKAMQVALIDNTEASNKQASELLRKLKFYQKLHVELDRLEDLLFDD
ncbi:MULTISPECIES: Fe-S protein assembly co-chaperone HscB [Thalassotalea]|uniref:Fe-S protein assembly co-chaperone HscB n=1 Tax=Thalassotalea TaxID=1518149 RepID=UPI00094357BD|nr:MULTISPECIES: Fe-S protein assembly co-chaperone HscB [Thalassotalea]OKY25694.1 Fe-S protein assembly co-chaperone HscB [Thalassotalea sp. PP2-459]